jgi:hypothetical protein
LYIPDTLMKSVIGVIIFKDSFIYSVVYINQFLFSKMKKR